MSPLALTITVFGCVIAMMFIAYAKGYNLGFNDGAFAVVDAIEDEDMKLELETQITTRGIEKRIKLTEADK